MIDLNDPYWQANDDRARIAREFQNLQKAIAAKENSNEWREHALELVSCCHTCPYVDFASILPHCLAVAQDASASDRAEWLTFLVQWTCTSKIMKVETFDPVEFLKSFQDALLENFPMVTTDDQRAALLCGLAISQQDFELAGLLDEHLRQKGFY